MFGSRFMISCIWVSFMVNLWKFYLMIFRFFVNILVWCCVSCVWFGWICFGLVFWWCVVSRDLLVCNVWEVWKLLFVLVVLNLNWVCWMIIWFWVWCFLKMLLFGRLIFCIIWIGYYICCVISWCWKWKSSIKLCCGVLFNRCWWCFVRIWKIFISL